MKKLELENNEAVKGILQDTLVGFLNDRVLRYNQPGFIKDDPICVPHFFTKQQDIEIAGFFASIFAWGNRTTIIAKSKELMQRMDNEPHDFCRSARPSDLKQLMGFKHRTFTADDLFYFVDFFKQYYGENLFLEDAFSRWLKPSDENVEKALIGFRHLFFAKDHLKRTEKHISSPLTNSGCKRLNMFLRWMVRRDKAGVDFGIWRKIKPHQLICPMDVHVARVAKHLGLINRPQPDWKTALQLTHNLKAMDAKDPVKYDFALFGLGVVEKWI